MPTLFDYINKHAAERPINIALSHDSGQISYRALNQILKSSSVIFRRYGIMPKENVLVKTKNQLDYTLSVLCAMHYGCWAVPVNPDIKEGEIKTISLKTCAKELPDEVAGQFKLCHTQSNQETNYTGDTAGVLHMTSGSTGEPRFCVRNCKALTDEGVAYQKTFSIQRHDKILSGAPIYHSYAFGASLMASLVSGSCLFLADRFIPRENIRLIAQNRITIYIIVPIMAQALSSTYCKVSPDFTSIRIVLVGAGIVTPASHKRFKEKFSKALLGNYGSTETGGVISRLDPDSTEVLGVPMYSVKVKILDKSHREVKQGEQGVLWIKCPYMLSAYYGQAHEALFDEQGFFSTEDVVLQDTHGNLVYKGRNKLFISVGSKKVNPYEVEQLIKQYPGIEDCVVIGDEKSNGNETVVAYIVGQPAEEEDIRRFCKNALSDYKIPSKIRFVREIPRNRIGKIDREKLKGSL